MGRCWKQLRRVPAALRLRFDGGAKPNPVSVEAASTLEMPGDDDIRGTWSDPNILCSFSPLPWEGPSMFARFASSAVFPDDTHPYVMNDSDCISVRSELSYIPVLPVLSYS